MRAVKRLIINVLILILITVLISGCTYQVSPSQPPEISITAADIEIPYVIAKNKWNGAIYDREDTFHSIMKEGSNIEIPHIELGETVAISFFSSPPEKFYVYDILIDDKGQQIYTNKEIMNIPVKLKNGSCSFEISEHVASALSSEFIENKVEYRGYRMIATWGENECEYAFVVKTMGD
jgi:hypothetical protein